MLGVLFGCSSILTVVNKRKAKFLDNYLKSYNNLCKLFAYVAENKKKRNRNTVVELRTVGDYLLYLHILVKLSVVLCHLLPCIGE